MVFSQNVKDHGVYIFELVAAPTVVGVVTRVPFTVTIVDLCVSANFYP